MSHNEKCFAQTLRGRTMAMPHNPHCPKLTWRKVRELRRLRASGLSLLQLEQRFGISRQWVCKILKGDVWKERRKGSKGKPSGPT